MPGRTVILTIWRGTAALAVLLWVSQAAAAVVTNEAHARLSAFLLDVERLQRDASQATPAEMESLLAQSFELGRPQAAAALVKSYLRRHRDPPLSLLLKSAQVAEWSGDLRSAVDRYKRALQIATNAPSAPDTMLRLFRLQVQALDDGDDAFRLMTELGDTCRTTPALKRFDGWYLIQAIQRKDMRAMLRRMVLILSDRMPLELERRAYWDVLDALMRDLATMRPELFAVLPECRRIHEDGLIRGNEAWSKRFAFLTANLAFAADSVGKDAATQARALDAVARAARAYFDAAPSADSLREIECAFGGGWERFDPAQMAKCAEAKCAFSNYAFGKLDRTQRESGFGRTRFDYYTNGSARLATLSLGNREERKRYFELLNTWVDAREREPVKVLSATIGPVLQAYNDQAHPERRELAPAELDTLLRLFQLSPQWNWQECCQLDRILLDAMFAAKRYNEMFPLAPHLWGLARATPVEGDNMRARMVETTVKLADAGKLDLATTYAASGLSIMGNQLKDNQRTTLMTIKSKALAGWTGPVIPRSDRRFPLLQAQMNYQIGRTEDAWEACLDHHALFADCYREIDPNFSIWLINKLTEVGDYGDAEKYIGMMIQWVDQSPQSFAPADRVNLLLALANIPFQRQEYPKARAICEQILANKDFADVPERYDADLLIAEIDRLCKKYDAAIERLQKLLNRKPENFVRTGADYQMALASMGQAGYPDVNVREKQTTANLPAQPTEPLPQTKSNTVPKVRAEPAVRPSLRGSRAVAIGKPIRITLQDKNLAVVGRASSIEIRIWAASGDEETFALLSAGDTKYKFEGSIPTALAPMQKNDKVLQVLGGDTVYFDYSEAFKKANKIVGDPPAGIRVLSDSELYVSSDEIVSKEGRAQQEKDRMIRERLQRIAVEAGQVTTGSVNTFRTSE